MMREKMWSRSQIEKIIEQELSAILLQSIKVADSENKPEVKDGLKLILKVIGSRKEKQSHSAAIL